MATRDIKTRIVLEGEAEYKSKLKDINSQYSLLKSELAKLKSESAGSANSLDFLQKKVDLLTQAQQKMTEKLNASNDGLKNAQNQQDKYKQKVVDAQAKIEQVTRRQEELGEVTEETAEEHARLAEELKRYQEELQTAQAGQQRAEESITQWQSRVNYAQVNLGRLSQELETNEGYLEEARQSADHTATSIDEYGRRVRQAANDSEQLGESTGGAGGAVEALAGALAASGLKEGLGKIKDAITECVEASNAFETAMAKVGTIADTSAAPLSDLKDQIVNLSNELGVSASEIAESTYGAISASVNTAESVKFVEQATKLATGGFTDTTTAVDILSTAINAYGLETAQAAQLSDYLVTTQNLGKTTVAELASNMGKVIPIAAAYNVEMDNLSSAYAVLTSNGIATAESTTYLKAMLNELGDSGSVVSKTLQEKTGSSFAGLMKQGMSLGDVMDILGDSVGGNAGAFNELWSSSEAGVGALSLLGAGAEKYNSVLAQMEESTGATDAAFEKMADTAEFAKKRMETAFENLKIAIGDQLSPVLRDLSNAGADAFTWATDFVRENPEIVSLIASVAAGLGTLVVAITGLTAVTTIASSVWDTFNKIVSNHPAVMITTAIIALTAAIGAFILTSGDAETETEKLIKKTDELKGAVEETATSYREKQEELKKNSDIQSGLASELSKLINQENKTVQSKQRISELVNILNNEIPELSLAYDEQTDSLNMTIDALDELIEKQAAEEEYNAVVEERTELFKQRAEAVAALEEAEQNLSDAQAQMTEELERCKNEMTAQGDQYRYVSGRIEECQMAYDGAKQALEAIDTELAASDEIVANHQLAVAGMNETILEYRNSLMDTVAALGENSTGYTEVQEAIAGLDEYYITHVEQQQARIEEIREQQSALRAEYDATKQKVYDNLTNEIGMFETMSTKADRNIKDLIKSLDSQISYMDTYAENIQKAMELGVDKGLVLKLSDGSQESAKILQAIVNDGGEHVTEFNEKLSKVEEGKDAFSSQVAEMETNFNQSMRNLSGDLEQAIRGMDKSDEAYQNGLNTIQGFLDGSEEKRGSIVSKYQSLAEAANRSFRNTLNIKSPSRVFAESGRYTVEGVIKGTEEKIPELERAYADTARAAIEAYSGQARIVEQEMQAKQYISYISAPTIQNGYVMPHPEFALSDSTVQAMERLVETLEQNRQEGITQNVTIVSPERTPAENARALKKVGRKLAFGG